MAAFGRVLETDSVLDCLDYTSKWYQAIVLSATPSSVRVHYLGFGDNYDENIDRTSSKLAPLNTHTTPSKYQSLCKEFVSVVKCSEAVAYRTLHKHNFDIHRATEAYLEAVPKVDQRALNAAFDSFAKENKDSPDVLRDEVLCAFFTAIGIDPELSASLVIAWKLKCKRMGEIKRTEFVAGWTELHADSIASMKGIARQQVKVLDTLDGKTFAPFYRYLFDFYKNNDERKVLELDVADEAWTFVLKKHFALYPKWIAFLKSRNWKGVSYDLWNMTYQFARDVKSDLSNFDVDGNAHCASNVKNFFLVQARGQR